MRILIITIHNIHNFGSVTQAAALYQYIKSLGYNVKIINYNPDYFRKMNLSSILGRLLSPISYIRKSIKFKKYIKENMDLTKPYNSFEQLKKDPPLADLYISGGDQLWNTYYQCGKDPAYKLKFVKGRKIAFGTSLGRDNYAAEELIDITNKVSDYDFLGLREASSVQMLNNIKTDKVFNVVDPVLLLSKNYYLKNTKHNKFGQYLFVYLVGESELLNKAVDYISRTLNLKIVLCSGFRKKCKYDYFIKDEGPEDVIGYINNATFVLSASYHATLFSIMLKKDFLVLLPGENTNARILDLLTITNLKKRKIMDYESINKDLLNNINFEDSHKRLNALIESSKEILRSYLMETCKCK